MAKKLSDIREAFRPKETRTQSNRTLGDLPLRVGIQKALGNQNMNGGGRYGIRRLAEAAIKKVKDKNKTMTGQIPDPVETEPVRHTLVGYR